MGIKNLNKLGEFTDECVASLSASLVSNIEVKKFTTSNVYAAFQLARLLKKSAIFFDDFFDVKYLGFGLKSGIKVFLSSGLVNDANKGKLAEFAASKFGYNPTELKGDDYLFVSKSGVGDVYDIDIAENDRLVFYSNIKANGYKKVSRIIGFSADNSIFNVSRSLEKQLRIAKFVNKGKKNFFKTYSNDELKSFMNTKGTFTFSHLKFILGQTSLLTSNSLFSSLIKNMPAVKDYVKQFDLALNSLTKKEVFNPLLMKDKSRQSRVAAGSKLSSVIVERMCQVCLQLYENDMSDIMKKASGISPEFKKLESLLNTFKFK